jgi:hypothetical protein
VSAVEQRVVPCDVAATREPQFLAIQRGRMRSPLSCSLVIFATRAWNSTAESSLPMDFSRRVMSLRTEFSLSSELISRQLGTAAPLERVHFSGIVILPLVAAGASLTRAEAEWWGPFCGYAASPDRRPDSIGVNGKDAAKRDGRR